MFLKQLKIIENGKIVRNIPFHKGVNLILDTTPKSAKSSKNTDSGNSVGKTTVIRLIDYCLGSDGKNIYHDQEFKTQVNTIVENYLKDPANNIIIELVITEDIERDNSKKITIRRNFLPRTQKLYEIDGEKYKESDFVMKLKELLFESTEAKPTLRQLIAKNLRDAKNRLDNTIQVLNAYTTREEYQTLYYFMFGIPLSSADEAIKLQQQIRHEESLQKSLNKGPGYSQVLQSLNVIEDLIKNATIKKDAFKVTSDIDDSITTLNKIRTSISICVSKINRLEFRQKLIKQSIEALDKQRSDIDMESVKELYKQAKILIPSLQKTFEETCEFHNKMINNKQQFISRDLPSLTAELANNESVLNLLLLTEKEILGKLSPINIDGEFEQIITELNQLHERKGELTELKAMWENSIKELRQLNEKLTKIQNGIKDKDEMLNNAVTKFNKYFADISSKLYKEPFVLSYDETQKGKDFIIGSAISANLGAGMKKGEALAFDLAYIKFADNEGIKCLHFTCHDRIENIHDNQLTTLLNDVVNDVNCQLILPVLKDKLPNDLETDELTVVTLSQNDKLFKI